jgi:hypothetical protein
VPRIIPIVEGHGEFAAAPILVRRIASIVAPDAPVEVLRPIRVPRNRLLRLGELERAVEFAARQAGPDGRILILIDADRDCPAQRAPAILHRAKMARGDRLIRVVMAKREYEAWLIAAAASIAGHRSLDASITAPADAESIADAKGWLSDRMAPGHSYRETLDQPALTDVFDLNAARVAPSFDKLWRDVGALL